MLTSERIQYVGVAVVKKFLVPCYGHLFASPHIIESQGLFQ